MVFEHLRLLSRWVRDDQYCDGASKKYREFGKVIFGKFKKCNHVFFVRKKRFFKTKYPANITFESI